MDIITAMHSASVCRWRLDILNYTCTIRIVPSHQVVKTVMMHLRTRPTITKCKILRCRNSCSAGAIETTSACACWGSPAHGFERIEMIRWRRHGCRHPLHRWLRRRCQASGRIVALCSDGERPAGRHHPAAEPCSRCARHSLPRWLRRRCQASGRIVAFCSDGERPAGRRHPAAEPCLSCTGQGPCVPTAAQQSDNKRLTSADSAAEHNGTSSHERCRAVLSGHKCRGSRPYRSTDEALGCANIK